MKGWKTHSAQTRVGKFSPGPNLGGKKGPPRKKAGAFFFYPGPLARALFFPLPGEGEEKGTPGPPFSAVLNFPPGSPGPFGKGPRGKPPPRGAVPSPRGSKPPGRGKGWAPEGGNRGPPGGGFLNPKGPLCLSDARFCLGFHLEGGPGEFPGEPWARPPRVAPKVPPAAPGTPGPGAPGRTPKGPRDPWPQTGPSPFWSPGPEKGCPPWGPSLGPSNLNRKGPAPQTGYPGRKSHLALKDGQRPSSCRRERDPAQQPGTRCHHPPGAGGGRPAPGRRPAHREHRPRPGARTAAAGCLTWI